MNALTPFTPGFNPQVNASITEALARQGLEPELREIAAFAERAVTGHLSTFDATYARITAAMNAVLARIDADHALKLARILQTGEVL